MKYDFNQVIDRHGSGSTKYDFMAQNGRKEDAIPLWVADMDFATAPEITESLQKRVAHGIFGYSRCMDGYYDAVENWMETSFAWHIEREWIIQTPGIVFALFTAIRAYSEAGDCILVQPPVYPPFFDCVRQNNRKLVENPLKLENGYYSVDFEDFEKKIIDSKVKIFLLCNPHNPVGRVWTKEELIKAGDICQRHNVLVISDEIHADFIFSEYKHTSFASISKQFEDNSVICTSPSKTFNIAGLQVSNIIIANTEKRKKIQKKLAAIGFHGINLMGIVACEAAYRKGREWLIQLKKYLEENKNYVKNYLEINLPDIKLVEPQGTYLLWIDFRNLNWTQEKLDYFLCDKTNIWLNSGVTFGEGGEGFERMNIACPRSTITVALERLTNSMKLC